MRATILVEDGSTTPISEVSEVLVKADALVHEQWPELGMISADLDAGIIPVLEAMDGVTVIQRDA